MQNSKSNLPSSEENATLLKEESEEEEERKEEEEEEKGRERGRERGREKGRKKGRKKGREREYIPLQSSFPIATKLSLVSSIPCF